MCPIIRSGNTGYTLKPMGISPLYWGFTGEVVFDHLGLGTSMGFHFQLDQNEMINYYDLNEDYPEDLDFMKLTVYSHLALGVSFPVLTF